jgi:hypothetical protein
MKHLLNNMSEEEKNAIREQHTGGMKVITENFNKLLGSKLGNVKPLVSEALNLGVEPVYNQNDHAGSVAFSFEEGETTYPSDVTKYIVNEVSRRLKSTISTLQTFNKNNQTIPSFIELYVGTSSTGTATTNKNVASGRMNYLRSICEKALATFGIRADVAFKLITQNYSEYQPSQVDTSFYDTTKAKPIDNERDCYIVIKPLETKGLTPGQVGELQGGLIDASSIINTFLVDNVDEDDIVLNISKLQTYSDITDLNTALINARKGPLETFLNDQLSDDIKEKTQVVNSLNNCARRSSKPPVAKIMNGGDIAIMLP